MKVAIVALVALLIGFLFGVILGDAINPAFSVDPLYGPSR